MPRSHTHRCTGTKFWCDRRAHTHGDTCTYTSAPEKLLEWHAGRVRTYREHTDTHRDPRTTPAHAHTTPRRPRLGTSFEGLGRLPPSVAGSSQFLHSLWPYLVHADPLRPLVPRWRGHAGLTKQGSSLHSRVQAPGRPAVCTPAGRAAARLGLPRTTTPRRRRAAPTQRLRPLPRAGVTETTTPRRPCVGTLWKEDSASPRARGGRGRQLGAGLRVLKEGGGVRRASKD